MKLRRVAVLQSHNKTILSCANEIRPRAKLGAVAIARDDVPSGLFPTSCVIKLTHDGLIQD